MLELLRTLLLRLRGRLGRRQKHHGLVLILATGFCLNTEGQKIVIVLETSGSLPALETLAQENLDHQNWSSLWICPHPAERTLDDDIKLISSSMTHISKIYGDTLQPGTITKRPHITTIRTQLQESKLFHTGWMYNQTTLEEHNPHQVPEAIQHMARELLSTPPFFNPSKHSKKRQTYNHWTPTPSPEASHIDLILKAEERSPRFRLMPVTSPTGTVCYKVTPGPHTCWETYILRKNRWIRKPPTPEAVQTIKARLRSKTTDLQSGKHDLAADARANHPKSHASHAAAFTHQQNRNFQTQA